MAILITCERPFECQSDSHSDILCIREGLPRDDVPDRDARPGTGLPGTQAQPSSVALVAAPQLTRTVHVSADTLGCHC